MQHGFVKVAAATPRIKVANPEFNAQRALDVIRKCVEKRAKIIVLPELTLTGVTSNDLFLQDILIRESKSALQWLALETKELDALVFVGLPWKKGNKLYNVAAVLNHGKVLALIPQTKIPNYGDRDGMRYFAPASDKNETVSAFGYEIPFGNRILFQAEDMEELVVGCEIGEDLFAIQPPSIGHVMAGATIITNLYAGGEMVAAEEYRKTAVVATSKRLASGYIMSGAGEGESTQDLVFFGHKIVAENGNLLSEGFDYDCDILCQDIDVFRLIHERVRKNIIENADSNYQKIDFKLEIEECVLERKFPHMPFIPTGEQERKKRLSDIFRIQASGLKKRLAHTGCGHAIIGISGGLDSTLALLVTAKAFDMLGIPRKQIHSITMPCFGTTDRTYDNACKMALALGTVLEEVDIKESVDLHFRDIKQDRDNHNVTYENSQARERTQVLMDIANRENGMVIGTGDMSELALGWATYNGDHMSMYGVNAGVPKTLVRHLVKYYADTCGEEELKQILLDVLDTPVSPELLPPVDGVIAQKTEDLVGPYELHDFFLYYMMRFGYEPAKIYRIAMIAFAKQYEKEVILKWLTIFVRRFFTQQFKRSCLPDGPKVGSVSLSPRGDLRMPSDAVADIWLQQLEKCKK
ncbi:MAG: NAD(+) synthase [Lachnospiraceae bacterium]|nr:NAD(+) synthase [Lachnospiraceae bacterium]